MKNLLPLTRNALASLVFWLGVFAVTGFVLDRWKLHNRPTLQVIFCAGLAIYNVLVLVPLALGSRERLAEGAMVIGTSNPLLARIMCIIAMLFVFVAFLAVTLLYQEVNVLVRIGGVLLVVGVGIFSGSRRARGKAGVEP